MKVLVPYLRQICAAMMVSVILSSSGRACVCPEDFYCTGLGGVAHKWMSPRLNLFERSIIGGFVSPGDDMMSARAFIRNGQFDITSALQCSGSLSSILHILKQTAKDVFSVSSFSFYELGGMKVNWQGVSRSVLDGAVSCNPIPLPADLAFPAEPAMVDGSTYKRYASLESILTEMGRADWEYAGTLGRKIIYRSAPAADGSYRYLSFKVRKADESLEILQREHNNLSWMHRAKPVLGMRGALAVSRGIMFFKAGEFVAEMKDGNGLPVQPATDPDGYISALLLDEESVETLSYLDGARDGRDITGALIDERRFSLGFETCIHDLFTLLPYGIVHPDLIGLFHENRSREKREDYGYYNWLYAGRIDAPLWHAMFSNCRVGGLADFANLVDINRITRTDIALVDSTLFYNNESISSFFTVDDLYADFCWDAHSGQAYDRTFRAAGLIDKPLAYRMYHMCGSYWLSLALVRLSWMHRRGCFSLRESDQDGLRRCLWEMFRQSYEIFTGREQDGITAMADWSLMARQMIYFMDDAYAHDLPLAQKGQYLAAQSHTAVSASDFSALRAYLTVQSLFPGAQLEFPAREKYFFDQRSHQWGGWTFKTVDGERYRDAGAYNGKVPFTELFKAMTLIAFSAIAAGPADPRPGLAPLSGIPAEQIMDWNRRQIISAAAAVESAL